MRGQLRGCRAGILLVHLRYPHSAVPQHGTTTPWVHLPRTMLPQCPHQPRRVDAARGDGALGSVLRT